MFSVLGHQATGTGQQSAGIGHQAIPVSHPATGMGHQARGMSLQSNYLGLASASAIMSYAECSVPMTVTAPTLQPVQARGAVPAQCCHSKRLDGANKASYLGADLWSVADGSCHLTPVTQVRARGRTRPLDFGSVHPSPSCVSLWQEGPGALRTQAGHWRSGRDCRAVRHRVL